MRTISGAEAIVRSLLVEGVDVLFGYPGGAIMPMYDALYTYRDRLQHVLVRHEQGAVHAAEGYARTTGRPGVVVVTSGPGATNTVTGLADAMLDSIPVVCLTGQVVSSVLGSDAFQETDVVGITTPVTKWNYQITKASEIPEILAKAFYIARTGRPGPVVVDITKDAQTGQCEFRHAVLSSLNSYRVKVDPDPEGIKAAAELINGAERPYLLVGHGILVSGAQRELVKFVDKSGIPVGSTLLGLSAFPPGHELYTGMLGMHGHYGPNVLSNEADLIIAIGMRFDDRVTSDLSRYLKQAKVIHIDIDPAEIDKNVKTTVAIQADARQALRALLPHVKKRSFPEWLGRFRQCEQIEYEKIIKPAIAPPSGGLRMAEVIHQLSEKTKGEAVIVSDVGQHQMMAARYYRYNRPDSFVTSGGLGTMGFGLPAAMGCAVGVPKRLVIAIVGDGSFQMTIQELGTVAQEQLPIKVLVLKNHFLGMVRQWQELFFDKRYSSTPITSPDFVKVADAYGIDGDYVTDREHLSAALDIFLSEPGPYVLEVEVEHEDNVFPMVTSGSSVSDIRLE